MSLSHRISSRRVPGPRCRLAAGISLAMIGLAWCGFSPESRRALARQDGNADPTRALVERQGELSLKALDLIAKSLQIGAPVVASSQDTIYWSKQLLGARLYLSLGAGDVKTQDPEVYFGLVKGASNPSRVAAFEDHNRRMRVVEDRYRDLYAKGNCSAFQFATFESAHLQAEIWLSRERNR